MQTVSAFEEFQQKLLSLVWHWTSSDGETTILKLFGAWSSTSFKLLPGQLWSNIYIYIYIFVCVYACVCTVYKVDGWLFGFYGISAFCWLFNAESIFMKIVQFQTIQFRISTQLKCKYSLIVKIISISSYPS